jgi:MarR family transcriptional regulator, lower aerobic nicotinate degradation pathway regulator
MTEPDGYVLEDQIGFRLRKAHHRASEIFGAVMGGFEVTPTQFAALAKLHETGPLPQNQLGRLTAMDPATIFGVVSRLTKRGLVRQAASEADGRMLMVSLTPEGEAVAAHMRALGPEVSRRTLAPLTRREAETLLRLVAKLG